ncbi:MAG: isoprenylcysteine carboxylmethyltransferase family protein [Micropepsaceae bacterium]
MRILPPVALLVSILVQVAGIASLWPITPSGYELAVGAVCAITGLILAPWGANLFTRVGTGLVPFTPATKLVVTGPFRLTRNPMYVGFILFSAGVAIASGVHVNLISPLLLAIWLHYSYVLPEERFMRERFGADYDEYCRKIPRWL